MAYGKSTFEVAMEFKRDRRTTKAYAVYGKVTLNSHYDESYC